MKANIDVSFSQIAIFSSEIAKPFSIWRDSHIAQGFVWRPGAVSFKTLVESGLHSVELLVTDGSSSIDSTAIRAIQVPFRVSSVGEIEVASIADGSRFKVAPGGYALTCEFLPAQDGVPRVIFCLRPCEDLEFRYLRTDQQIRPPTTVDATAEPA